MIKSKKTAKQAYADFAKWLDRKDSAAPNPWCPAGVAGCALGYGYFVGYGKKVWNCSVWVSIAKALHTWRAPEKNDGKYGDAVIFDWTGKKVGNDHIGFFIKEDKNFVWHISANSRNGLVRINKTSKKYITGYGTVVQFASESPVSPVEAIKPIVETPKPPKAVTAPIEPPKAAKPIKIANPKIVVPETAKPKHKYITVEKGDSYWSIACRALSLPNVPKNYTKIATKSAQIQVLNKKKALFAKDMVRVA